MLCLDFETILNRTMILIEHFHRMTFCLQVYESQSIFGFRHGKQTLKSRGFDSTLSVARALLEWNRTQTISTT